MDPENLKYTVGTIEYYVEANKEIPKEQLSYEENLAYLKNKVETGNLSKEALKEILETISYLQEHKEEYDRIAEQTEKFKATTRK